jgi:hypothetical protein
VIAARDAVLLVAPAHVENGTGIGVVTESVAYQWGLIAFWRPSGFRVN